MWCRSASCVKSEVKEMTKAEAAQILEADAARLVVTMMALESKKKLYDYDYSYTETLKKRLEEVNLAIQLLEEHAEEERWR